LPTEDAPTKEDAPKPWDVQRAEISRAELAKVQRETGLPYVEAPTTFPRFSAGALKPPAAAAGESGGGGGGKARGAAGRKATGGGGGGKAPAGGRKGQASLLHSVRRSHAQKKAQERSKKIFSCTQQ
jgi:hypothetical protein